MRKTLLPALSLVFPLVFTPTPADSFDLETHEALSRRAIQGSLMPESLKEQLGFSAGSAATVNDRSVADWIAQVGSRLEDSPFLRGRNHFHNPTLSWDRAGLRLLAITFESLVLWGQDRGQVLGGKHSWHDARAAFLRALAAGTDSERQQAYAETFQSLGHLIHLVQDAASPAHTRNDSHITFLGIGDPDGFHAWAEKKDNLRTILDIPSKAADRSVLALPSNPLAPVPIARIVDTERYRQTGIPEAGVNIGIAEYSNANFFSDDTIFSDFTLPRDSSVELGAPETEPKTGELRRYLRKVREGETGYRLAVPSALFDNLQDALTNQEKGLDDLVFQDYGRLLFPRAIGYSAGLLDYFFRGRLDVDLVDDPDNPGRLQVSGTNASEDALGPGTLSVYVEDAGGIRTAGTPPGGVPLGVTHSGDALPNIGVSPSDSATRLVAVYQGALGNETPSLTSPGAVIGKVFRGVRVEEVFADAQQWKIRTPTGVFPLPLARAEFEQVQWGDDDNRLVARTLFGPGKPSRVVAYDVLRQPGSRAFVLTEDGSALQLVQANEATFPFGMSLETTVMFEQTMQYRQQLARFERKAVMECIPAGPGYCRYVFDHDEIGPLTVETAPAQTLHFTDSFSIVLDQAHLFPFGTGGKRYKWLLQDVAADASGRLLGLVLVVLTSPGAEPVSVPVFGVNVDTGETAVVAETQLRPSFPGALRGELLWALIDLTNGSVVASTAERTIAISSRTETARGFSGGRCRCIWLHEVTEYQGGPQEGTTGFWVEGVLENPRPSVPIAYRTPVTIRSGDESLTVTGWRRGELSDTLSQHGLLSFELGRYEGASDFVYGCTSPTGSAPSVCSAVTVLSSGGAPLRPPLELADARRARPAPAGGERVVFLGEAGPGLSTPAAGHLIVWDPDGPSAAARLRLRDGAHVLGTTTGSVATVWFQNADDGQTGSFLIPLGGGDPIFFPDADLTRSFVMLEPSYLYNVDDLKFYRLKPPLRATTLPSALVDVAADPLGDFHAIRLR